MSEHDDQERIRSTRRWRAWVAGGVAVGLAAAAAVAATSATRDPSGVAGTSELPVPPAPPGSVVRSMTRVVHEFSAPHVGPVWLTVTIHDGTAHELVLGWGPWQRWFHQREAGPVTYWFEKKDPESVPVELDVPAGASATFGEGSVPPPGAVDARPGWTRRP